MTSWLRWLLLVLGWLVCQTAGAQVITCTSITSPGVSIGHTNGVASAVQTFFTVTCNRPPGAPATVSYSVVPNNGLNRSGQQNRARNGTALLDYDVYKTSTGPTACTVWKNTPTVDSITWAATSYGVLSKSTPFWGCMPAQTATTAGTYSDIVQLTLTYNGLVITGDFPVSIYTPAVCTFTSPAVGPLGTISLAYTAFGSSASGSLNFSSQCTVGMPYSLATDVPEGVLANLRYILTLSSTSAVGTGAAQSHSVTATIPAGQAGTCAGGACTAQQTHTVIISY